MNSNPSYWFIAIVAIVAVAACGLLAVNLLAPRIEAWFQRRERAAAQARASMPRHSSGRRAWRTRSRSAGRHSLTEMPTVVLRIPAAAPSVSKEVPV